MNNAFTSQAIEAGFYFFEQGFGGGFVFRFGELAHQRAHLAPVLPIAIPTFDILTNPLGGRFMLWHEA